MLHHLLLFCLECSYEVLCSGSHLVTMRHFTKQKEKKRKQNKAKQGTGNMVVNKPKEAHAHEVKRALQWQHVALWE